MLKSYGADVYLKLFCTAKGRLEATYTPSSVATWLQIPSSPYDHLHS